jgi:exodeoxyribonuclease-1
MRDKKKIAVLVEKDEPFVYTSGKYPAEFEKTTVALRVCAHQTRNGCAYVYDLRHDPTDWLQKTPEQLAEAWKWKKDSDEPRLPVKQLQYNHCPAVAPTGVLDDKSCERLQINLTQMAHHAALLKKDPEFQDRLCKAADILDKMQQSRLFSQENDVDCQMYDGFFGAEDKTAMSVVRAARPEELSDLGLKFRDSRLSALLPLYKARNYPKLLTGEERTAWEKFRTAKLLGGGTHSRMAKFLGRLQQVAADGGLTGHQEYLLEELKLYAESIMPDLDVNQDAS